MKTAPAFCILFIATHRKLQRGIQIPIPFLDPTFVYERHETRTIRRSGGERWRKGERGRVYFIGREQYQGFLRPTC